MLNSKNIRELAYLVKVDNITPMDADRLECAHVGGWHCVVGKGEFNVGDPAVYFEIDSRLPDEPPFSDMEFLRSKHFRIRTQRIRGEYSQGLLMPVSAWGWSIQVDGSIWMPEDGDHGRHYLDDDSRFLTERLKVTYAVPEDNARKGSGRSKDFKYKVMSSRHVKLAKTFWWRALMKREWGKKLLFFFFGKKKDKPTDWPNWVVKTDEERIQNMPWIVQETAKPTWYMTEKIDGTSTTFTMRQAKPKKREMFVCSRNVVFNAPEKEEKNFYRDTDGNVYLEMAAKYEVEKVLNYLLDHYKHLEYVTIQGETYGGGIQKRNYSTKDHNLAIFNLIYKYDDEDKPTRLNPEKLVDFISNLNKDANVNLQCVPYLGTCTLPDTVEEVLTMAHGDSIIDGQMREGIVFRSEDGVRSFKAVDNEYLLKYHVG